MAEFFLGMFYVANLCAAGYFKIHGDIPRASYYLLWGILFYLMIKFNERNKR